MKIAIICHYTNLQVQKKIKPWKRIREFAPWIENLTKELKKYPEHDFYIISPHQWLFKDKKYTDKNINYYFYRWGMPIIGRRWPAKFDIDFFFRYRANKRKVSKFISEVAPDVINLYGVENPYYSSTIMQFEGKAPVLITIQGFSGNSRRTNKLNSYQKYRFSLEQKIIKSFNNFNIRTDDMWKQIRGVNPSAIAYKYSSIVDFSKFEVAEVKKKYDFVFFARISEDKGIFDYLKAISIIKKTVKNVTAIVIGPCNNRMLQRIDGFIKENNIEQHIKMIGFIEKQRDLFKLVKQSRISVLPTYNDLISGTIIESMFLKVPVVTYRTGSIPEVNKNGENIIICDQGDQYQLSNKMQMLLLDKDKQLSLSIGGYNWATKRFNNEKAVKEYFRALDTVIDKFQNKVIL